MIEVSKLVKRYRDLVAVDGISFKVNQGELLGFLGPNGAGKTTTMRILTGALSATAGQVTVAGFDVFEHPIEAKRRVGYLPELPSLYEELSVDYFLNFAASLKGINPKKISEEIDRVIEVCGLKSEQHRRIGNLSKGYRQRVGLAQAFIGDPQVLILDEPTIGLDPNQIIEIRLLIKKMAENHTVILSTHMLTEVIQICSRVVIVHRGKLVADASLDRLTSETKSLEQTFHELTPQ